MGCYSIAKPTHRKKYPDDAIQAPSDRSTVPPISLPILDPRETEKVKEEKMGMLFMEILLLLFLRSLIHTSSREKNKTKQNKKQICPCALESTGNYFITNLALSLGVRGEVDG